MGIRSFQLSASQRQPPQGYISEWLRGTYCIIHLFVFPNKGMVPALGLEPRKTSS